MRNSIVLVLFFAVPFDAVTVSTLCPTNKIAPHRRIISTQGSNARTIGAFYDLLTPNSAAAYQNPYQDPLIEQPQEDDPDDCGEIEDYDENDLSSFAQPLRNRQERENRFFFGNSGNRPTRPPPTTNQPFTRPPRPQHPNHPPQRPPQPIRPPQQPSFPPQGPHQPGYPPQRPPQPIRPPQQPIFPPQGQPGYPPAYPPQRPPQASYPPQRPPYWSGGVFSNNQYQTPSYDDPSDNFKPVHETSDFLADSQTYRPGVVGGPLGHVVGLIQARPTTPTPDKRRGNELRYSTQATYSTRRPRTRKLSNNNSVIGSFIDLLF